MLKSSPAFGKVKTCGCSASAPPNQIAISQALLENAIAAHRLLAGEAASPTTKALSGCDEAAGQVSEEGRESLLFSRRQFAPFAVTA